MDLEILKQAYLENVKVTFWSKGAVLSMSEC